MRVFVKNQRGQNLMPCSQKKTRLLLKQNKAKITNYNPFTIQLLVPTGETIQECNLGIDSGAKNVGFAITSQDKVLIKGEIELRQDVSKLLTTKRTFRKSRRNRKTRYRKARWENRKNSIKEDRFSPTIVSKINSHLKEINFVKSILPIQNVILETATFDPHALKNPAVLHNKWLYQKGVNYGFANTRAYVLDRDNYTCQYCKGKSKDSKLEVHHIIFRSQGGSDESKNLITLCKTCHGKLHNGKINLKKNGKVKGQLKHATQMNSIRQQLLRLLPEAAETFGFITKEHRQLMKLPKEHYYDAVAIACLNNIENTGLIGVNFKTKNILYYSLFKSMYREVNKYYKIQDSKNIDVIEQLRREKNQEIKKLKEEYQNSQKNVQWLYRKFSDKCKRYDLLKEKANPEDIERIENMKFHDFE